MSFPLKKKKQGIMANYITEKKKKEKIQHCLNNSKFQ